MTTTILTALIPIIVKLLGMMIERKILKGDQERKALEFINESIKAPSQSAKSRKAYKNLRKRLEGRLSELD